LVNSPWLFSILVGITSDQFETLHCELYPKLESIRLASSSSFERKQIQGRPRKLGTKEQLLLFLIWMRQYPTQYFLAFMFGINPSNISNYLATTLSILYEHLKTDICWPSRTNRDQNSTNFKGKQISVVVDGSEQEVVLFSKCEKGYYSGKKHKHTMIILLTCSPTGVVYFLSSSYRGAKNDLNIFWMKENLQQFSLDEDEYVIADKVQWDIESCKCRLALYEK